MSNAEWISKIGEYQGLIYSSETGNNICVVYNHGDMEANANLIAAAPDMYEALKDLVRYHEKHGSVVPNLTDALSALAKAEGR